MNAIIEAVMVWLRADSALVAAIGQGGLMLAWPPERAFDNLAKAGEGSLVVLGFAHAGMRSSDAGDPAVQIYADIFANSLTEAITAQSLVKRRLDRAIIRPAGYAGGLVVYQGGNVVNERGEKHLAQVSATFKMAEVAQA